MTSTFEVPHGVLERFRAQRSQVRREAAERGRAYVQQDDGPDSDAMCRMEAGYATHGARWWTAEGEPQDDPALNVRRLVSSLYPEVAGDDERAQQLWEGATDGAEATVEFIDGFSEGMMEAWRAIKAKL